jgi:N-acetylmuramoyl-L-alanine amidase
MKKLAALLIVIGTLSSFEPYSAITLRHYLAQPIHTVVIDPGHNKFFTGTKGLFSKEEDVTLEIGLRLGEAINKTFPNIKVVYTRTTENSVEGATTLKEDLHDRANIANQSRGNLFISIHCDAMPPAPGGYYAKRVIGHKKKLEYVGKGSKKHKKWVNAPIYESYWVKNTTIGATTYIWKAQKETDKINAITRKDEETGGEEFTDSTDSANRVDWDTQSPEAKMMAQIYEQRYFKKSAVFATMVEDEFEKAGRKVWGVKQRDKGIQVLEATGMPSVLIETGYLSNKEEEEYLNSEKGQDEVVQNIIDALGRYIQYLDGVKAPSSAQTSDSLKK